MAGRYVFEIIYKYKSGDENHKKSSVVIINSLKDFSQFQADLSKCTPDPFRVQYVDYDEDIVSLDSEEEFKEFVKMTKKCASNAMPVKLILDFSPLNAGSNNTQESSGEASGYSVHNDAQNMEDINELKLKMKAELKEEILTEIKDQLGLASKTNIDLPEKDADYEEDSDENLILLSEKRKQKLLHKQKKLEKKERLAETKIDQHLEKLEMKKKRLLEKAEQRLRTAACRKSMVDPRVDFPCIMSMIASPETSILLQRAVTGKPFYHTWQVLNDGTVTVNNVELRHTWSSAGLEPMELSVKCPTLAPEQHGFIRMGFKAPNDIMIFKSYWHFYYQVGSQWQQFGHYVLVRGETKSPKHSALEGEELPKPVVFKESKETKVSNDDSYCTHKMNLVLPSPLEATWASSAIAAEMAKEAANAALRRATGCISNSDPVTPPNTTKTSEMDMLNNGIEKSVQGLNLLDSGSDSDANVEVNEEDPEFVIVDIETFNPKEMQDITSSGTETSTTKKEINTVNLTNETEESACVLSEDKEIAECRDRALEENNVNSSENKEVTFNKTKSTANFGTEPPKEECFYKNFGDNQLPVTFPRIDPNVNFPVFPPQRMDLPYPPHPLAAHQHMPPGFPVFPPQNPSSPAMVFPTPPMMHFTTPKPNLPMHYAQMPAYPPMMAPSHPLALISSGLPQPTALPPRPCNNLFIDLGTLGTSKSNSTNNISKESLSSAVTSSTTTQALNATSTVNDPLSCHNVMTPTPSVQDSSVNSPSAITGNFSPVTTSDSKDRSANIMTVPTPYRQTTMYQTVGQLETHPTGTNKKEGVQILPQALVDGAINVATTAYSTAWNALHNLRPKEGEATEFDPVFENNMALLIEMGFNNIERNARLLKKFNNDVHQVIGVICSTGGGDLLLD